MLIFSRYLDEMKHLYTSTEKQLIEFNELIPFYKNNWDVYSPILYSILQLSCSQIESMLKKIVNEMGFKPKNDKIRSYYTKLNKNKLLEKQKVLLADATTVVVPFTSNKLPIWWKAYNDTKHTLPEGIVSGTIFNTINALAGLYCLHNIAFLITYGYDVMDDSKWNSAIYPKYPNRNVDFHNSYFGENTHQDWRSKLFHHTTHYVGDLENMHTYPI